MKLLALGAANAEIYSRVGVNLLAVVAHRLVDGLRGRRVEDAFAAAT